MLSNSFLCNLSIPKYIIFYFFSIFSILFSTIWNLWNWSRLAYYHPDTHVSGTNFLNIADSRRECIAVGQTVSEKAVLSSVTGQGGEASVLRRVPRGSSGHWGPEKKLCRSWGTGDMGLFPLMEAGVPHMMWHVSHHTGRTFYKHYQFCFWNSLSSSWGLWWCLLKLPEASLQAHLQPVCHHAVETSIAAKGENTPLLSSEYLLLKRLSN